MNNTYQGLRFASACFEDARAQVVRFKNRIKAAERNGWADPAQNASLEAAEAFCKAQERMLVLAYRKEAPQAIRDFQKATLGLGEPGIARLVAALGDFRTYTEAWWEEGEEGEDARRTLVTGDEPVTCGVRDIWAYCGMGNPEARRRRGRTQEEQLMAGSPRAKDAAWQAAKAIVYCTGSPYRKVYDTVKERAAQVHPEWTKGHCDAHAVRLVAKALLKDLWRVQHGQEAVFGARTPWKPRQVQAA